jgi:hypothetical protein
MNFFASFLTLKTFSANPHHKMNANEKSGWMFIIKQNPDPTM